MRILGIVVAGFLAMPMAAQACPWAGNVYKIGGNISDLLFSFDSSCNVVRISRVTSASENFPVKLAQKKRY